MSKQLYRSIWRWHFFSGLYVVPFMLMLSLTGLVMLAGPWMDSYQYGEALTTVEAEIEKQIGEKLEGQAESEILVRYSADFQLAKVKKAYPTLQAAQYVPPVAETQSSIFKMRGDNFATTLVFVNPYNGKILGDFDSSDRWYSIADNIHGTLMIGQIGDALIELSAGLTILLLMTGLYLYWPKTTFTFKALFSPGFLLNWHKQGTRPNWKAIHASLGFYCSLFILFFALTGMAWTGIWGQQLVQPYSSFPVEKRASSWQSNAALIEGRELIHGDLNEGQLNEIPWGLEQTPLPTSQPPTQTKVDSPSLDQIVEQGLDLGFLLQEGSRFRIALPLKADGVYTLMSIASSRDVTDPRKDRTLHIDQYSSKVLADIGWQDYNLAAKTMALGVPLHQGTLGWWNVLLASIVCLLLVLLSVSGIIMWWQRKPTAELGAPTAHGHFKNLTVSKSGKALLLICLMVAVLFPVTGGAMLLFLTLDRLRSGTAEKSKLAEL